MEKQEAKNDKGIQQGVLPGFGIVSTSDKMTIHGADGDETLAVTPSGRRRSSSTAARSSAAQPSVKTTDNS